MRALLPSSVSEAALPHGLPDAEAPGKATIRGGASTVLGCSAAALSPPERGGAELRLQPARLAWGCGAPAVPAAGAQGEPRGLRPARGWHRAPPAAVSQGADLAHGGGAVLVLVRQLVDLVGQLLNRAGPEPAAHPHGLEVGEAVHALAVALHADAGILWGAARHDGRGRGHERGAMGLRSKGTLLEEE